jgi:hypothetical protein
MYSSKIKHSRALMRDNMLCYLLPDLDFLNNDFILHSRERKETTAGKGRAFSLCHVVMMKIPGVFIQYHYLYAIDTVNGK